MKQLTWIWDDYALARETFLKCASGSGAITSSKRLSGHLSPNGDALYMDAAWIGSPKSRNVLLCLSGVHGFEGPAGSASQAAWLASEPTLPDDTSVLLVHAVNPFGYAWKSRSTEENVDLNRAFIDRNQGLPTNPGYSDVHPYLCPAKINTETLNDLQVFLKTFEADRGAAYANNAVGAGQYSHPNGLYFGGTEQPWSVTTLYAFLDEFISKKFVENIALVDLHTGRGPYAEPFFLCFDTPETQTFKNAAKWWGEDALLSKDELGGKYDGDAPPPRTGLLFHGVRQYLAPAIVSGCVVEFGTYDLWRMYEAELLDRWVRFKGERGTEKTESYAEKAFRAFCPEDPEWRRSVLTHGPQILTRALYGIAEKEVLLK